MTYPKRELFLDQAGQDRGQKREKRSEGVLRLLALLIFGLFVTSLFLGVAAVAFLVVGTLCGFCVGCEVSEEAVRRGYL